MISKTAVFCLKMYKKHISPFFPNTCRFYPSCSEYMSSAIEKLGIVKGLWLGCKRIVKCHPFHPGGYDPLPWMR